MNHIYNSVWNEKAGTFMAVSENVRSAGKKTTSSTSAKNSSFPLYIKALSAALMFVFASHAFAQPVGGVVVNGAATIQNNVGNTVINQSTQNAIINWQSFGINKDQSVQFVQPNANAVALNRVIGTDPSSIFGQLSANGKVFIVNPNGILFAKGASVNVGGLVASNLNISDSDFMSGNYRFSGNGTGTVRNEGNIAAANGGYIAMLGANVSNKGVIAANMGTVVLAAGKEVTLDVAGDGLLNVTVNKGAVNALIENGGLIQANGGKVILTASVAGDLMKTVVNNTGVIEAQTLNNRSGTIKLLAGLQEGTVNVGGKLDASAPNGGDGGFIEASAAHVKFVPKAQITTFAPEGKTGTFLIDPEDFIIGSAATDNISGADLSLLLVTNSVIITTVPGIDTVNAGSTPPVSNLFTSNAGLGDIYVNEVVSWTSSSNPTTLTLNAVNDVFINSDIIAVGGNFVVCCGRDIEVNAPITTTNGSVLLNAGRNINMNAAMTTTDGNITMCAANNINIGAALVLTTGSSIPAESLGLPQGLVLSAGYGAGAPEIGGGTLTFTPLAPDAAITGPNAPVVINYNPVSYALPTDYSTNFTLVNSSLTQNMYVFASVADKTFDNTTAATLTGLKGNPTGVSLVPLVGAQATFENADVGVNKVVNYSGYSLAVTGSNTYALAVSCCGPAVAKTTGNIVAATTVVPAPIVPAPIVPTPVVVVPPVVVPTPVVVAAPVIVPPITVVLSELPTVSVVEEKQEELIEETPVEEVAPVEIQEEVPYVAPVRIRKQDRD